MRIPSMTSIPHGSASIMHLRKLENGYARALDRSKENEDIVHLEEMSHSERMEFLKHDGALRQLQQDNERADFAKVEVTRVLDRVRSIRKDMQSLYNLELKIDKCTDPVRLLAMNYAFQKQQLALQDKIFDLADSLKSSDFYDGSLIAIEIRPGYTVNSSSEGSTLEVLQFVGLNVVGPGFSFSNRIKYLDLILIPHLSQDMETCDRAREVIDAEIKMHKSIISKLHVSQDNRKLQRADAKNRLDSFLMFLWDQMRWSRDMMKMMQGMS